MVLHRWQADHEDRKDIIIIGGGVIGCCCAYYLTRHPAYNPELHSITILEATKVAGGSSGKAGGLLQIQAEPTCLAPLSFKLHADLANEHDGEKKWGYRRVNVGDCRLIAQASSQSLEGQSLPAKTPPPSNRNHPVNLDWILPNAVQSYDTVSSLSDSAQVHPYAFTTSIADLAAETGVSIVDGTATCINRDSSNTKVDSVTFTTPGSTEVKVVCAADVILAAGPWTSSILPSASIGGARSHSVVVRPSRSLSNNCLWANIKQGSTGTPFDEINLELYPRPDGTLYSCEWADPAGNLPTASDKVKVDEKRCKNIHQALSSVSNELREGELTTVQACFQPVILKNGVRAKNAGPLLGYTGVDGLLLACGHDSWGVQNAPGTGLLVSEMVFEGAARSADISTLDPRRILGCSRLL